MNPKHSAHALAPNTVMGEHLDISTLPSTAVRRRGMGNMMGWLLFGLLIAAVWQVSQMQLYTSKSDTGYWLGVSGGTLMLLLFAYPLRKRWPLLMRMGKAKHWFVVHMFLGVFGPITIMAHCTFRIGSVNAGVALFSMLVVALSGLAGRFIYLRIHRGLGGEVESFDKLRKTLGFNAETLHTELSFAPRVEERLRSLDRLASRPSHAWAEHGRSLFVLPFKLRRQRRRCQRETDRKLAALAPERGWSTAELHKRQLRARQLVAGYTGAVLRVAQLAAYSKAFSLWHVLHVPFVIVMVVCAIAHVVAVHAY